MCTFYMYNAYGPTVVSSDTESYFLLSRATDLQRGSADANGQNRLRLVARLHTVDVTAFGIINQSGGVRASDEIPISQPSRCCCCRRRIMPSPTATQRSTSVERQTLPTGRAADRECSRHHYSWCLIASDSSV